MNEMEFNSNVRAIVQDNVFKYVNLYNNLVKADEDQLVDAISQHITTHISTYKQHPIDKDYFFHEIFYFVLFNMNNPRVYSWLIPEFKAGKISRIQPNPYHNDDMQSFISLINHMAEDLFDLINKYTPFYMPHCGVYLKPK